MSKWIVADTHFRSFHMLRYYEETYGQKISIEKYDAFMVKRWNERIHDDDQVYVLGDFSDNPHSLNQDKSLISKLNGHKTFVIGTHDKSFRTSGYWYKGQIDAVLMRKYWLEAGFDRVEEEKLELTYLGVKVLMTHERTRTPDGSGIVNVYGHNHDFKSKQKYYINVSMPVTGFEPTNLETAIQPYLHLDGRIELQTNTFQQHVQTKARLAKKNALSRPSFSDTYKQYMEDVNHSS